MRLKMNKTHRWCDLHPSSIHAPIQISSIHIAMKTQPDIISQVNDILSNDTLSTILWTEQTVFHPVSFLVKTNEGG